MTMAENTLERALMNVSLECSLENIKDSISAFESYNDFKKERFSLAIESYQRNMISTESFMETIKTYWRQFVEFLKKIWNRIKEFIESHFTLLGRRRKEINKLRENVLEIKDSIYIRKIKEQHKTFNVTNNNVKGLYLKKEFIKNYTGLINALKETHQAIEFLAGPYAQAISKRATVLKHALERANVDNAKDVFKELVDDLSKDQIRDISFNLLGNSKLEYKNNTDDIKTVADLKQMKAQLDDLGTIPEKEHIFETMEPNELVDVFTKLGDSLDLMERFRQGRYKEILKTQTELISTTDKFVNKITSYIKKENDDGHGSSEVSRDLMNLNSVYLDWIKTPVITTIQSVTKAFVQISRECEKNYFFYDINSRNLSKTLIGLLEYEGKETVLELRRQLNNLKPTNNLHVFYTDDPTIGFTGGACCSIAFKLFLDRINEWVSEIEGSKETATLSYPNFLKELKQLQSTLSLGDGVVLISNKLKEKLTPEELIAIRDHEYGHYFNFDWKPNEKNNSDKEIAADAYSLKNSKPSVLKSGLMKAVNFGASDAVVLLKDNILKTNPNWLVKKIATSRFIINSSKSFMISMAKTMHGRRLKTLEKLVKEEKANK